MRSVRRKSPRKSASGTTISKSRSFGRKDALLKDLDAQVDAITDRVVPVDPRRGSICCGVSWAWQLALRAAMTAMVIWGSVSLRADPARPIAQAAEPAPEALADRAHDALVANDYGQYGLVEVLAPALGEHGLSHLKNG